MGLLARYIPFWFSSSVWVNPCENLVHIQGLWMSYPMRPRGQVNYSLGNYRLIYDRLLRFYRYICHWQNLSGFATTIPATSRLLFYF